MRRFVGELVGIPSLDLLSLSEKQSGYTSDFAYASAKHPSVAYPLALTPFASSYSRSGIPPASCKIYHQKGKLGNVPRSFLEKLQPLWSQKKFVCVGLDPELEKISSHLRTKGRSVAEIIFDFNRQIIDATADLVCGYKPNSAFYEACGLEGMQALYKTVDYMQKEYPSIPVILDAKRADIGNTSKAYAKAAFEALGVDALTVNPYHGITGLEPFFAYKEKGVFVLIKTSNPEAKAIQDLLIAGQNEPLYKVLARQLVEAFGDNENAGIVVGATYPKELKEIRAIVGDMLFLIPGLGAQGGDLQQAVQFGKNSSNEGIILNFSRSIIYASVAKDFANKAREQVEKLHEQIGKSL